MKTKILILALVLVMVGTCMPAVAVQPTGENLITNGSFEDGLTGWKLAKGASGEPALTVSSGTVTADEKTDGSSAVMITGTSDERAVLRQFLPAGTLEAGKQYQLSACINITAGTKARFALREEDKYNGTAVCDLIGTNFDNSSSLITSATTNGWVRLSNVFTCTESTATNGCSFIVDTNGNELTLYVDDVQLRETDTGLLVDNGEFETLSPDFSRLTVKQHTTWLGRTNATMPGDLTLVRTEDYGTAICVTGRTSANSNLFVRWDMDKLNALPNDTTIKVSFRVKVTNDDSVEVTGMPAAGTIWHASSATNVDNGRYNDMYQISVADTWVNVEHFYTKRGVEEAKQAVIFAPGTLGTGTTMLIDSVSACVVEEPVVAEGKTLYVAHTEKTPKAGDEYLTTAPTTFVTTRISVDEAYTVGETASLYVHYPTLEETEQSGTVVCAVYSENTDNPRTLETVKTADITAIRRGASGTVVEFPLTGITMQNGKTYTLETMVWDGVSGLRPLGGATKQVAPITGATAE